MLRFGQMLVYHSNSPQLKQPLELLESRFSLGHRSDLDDDLEHVVFVG
jgi:hypothetical protein